MLFLFVGSSLCAPASFGRSLTVPPLPSASTCVNVSNTDRIHIQGTFTPLVHAHAGRTQVDEPDRGPVGPLPVMQALAAQIAYWEEKEYAILSYQRAKTTRN